MNIIIIGAGAAGLMAARLLSAKGHQVTVLEAQERIGGRIHTVHNGGFAKPVDLGAEFVHGNLPVTLTLLREAGIPYHPMEGEMWHFREGSFYQDDANAAHWELLMQRLNALEEDIPIKSFLEKEFPGAQYRDLQDEAERYVQGLDAANPEDASAFGLREEWNAEDEDQYTIEGGYGRLIRYLEDQCIAHGTKIHLNNPVKEIEWLPGKVRVRTVSGNEYESNQLLVTVPIGVLQAAAGAEGTIRFSPSIPDYMNAAKEVGAGNALKILLQFREPFWQSANGQDLSKLSFLLTTAIIPTWWTSYPQKNSVLTGWLGGPKAYGMKDLPPEEIRDKALQSLSEIFSIPESELSNKLDDWRIEMWPAGPYSRGSYSYNKVNTPAALKLLNTPLQNTICFAGEALYHGPAIGTVEAALSSAKDAAERMLQQTN